MHSFAGIIPPFTNPELRAAFAAWGGAAVQTRGGMQVRMPAPPPPEVWMPPVRRVPISEYAERWGAGTAPECPGRGSFPGHS